MIAKPRLDALTDGVFAVALTLLVIDLKLPDSFEPENGAALLHRLREIAPQALIYVMSFYVLGLRWVGVVRLAPRGEEVSEAYTKWALVHLLLVTFVPFTTSLVGRYPGLAPAVWLYAGNAILFSLVAWRMVSLADHRDPHHLVEHRIGVSMLILSSVLCIVVSFFAPHWALLAYLVNGLDEPIRRLVKRRHARPPA